MANLRIRIRKDKQPAVMAMPEDKVRWVNKSDTTLRVDFGNHSPFEDQYVDVPPNESERLTVLDEADGAYPYTVIPQSKDGEAAVAGPELIVEGGHLKPRAMTADERVQIIAGAALGAGAVLLLQWYWRATSRPLASGDDRAV